MRIATAVSHDRVLPGSEFAEWLILEWLGLEDVPEGVHPIGDQAAQIELDLHLAVILLGQFGAAVRRPEACGRHSRRQPVLQVALLLRKQRNDIGLAPLGSDSCRDEQQYKRGRRAYGEPRPLED